MKILYVSADLRRVGPTNQTLNIICNANDNLENVKVLTLFAEPEKSMLQEYLNKGVNVESLNLSRGNFLSICKALYKYLKQNSFDIVHSNGVKPDICLFFVAIFLKFKHVITLRNIPMEDAPTRMNKWIGMIIGRLHTFVIQHGKNVVACSKTVCNEMTKRYGCKNIKPIQNGVDVTKFFALNKNECRKKLNIASDAVVFISSGSFIPRKHNDLLIEAFLKSNVPNSILLLLGDGFLLNDLKEKYLSCSNVRFEGLVSNIQEYLSASDVFLSASDSEGLPNAVLEAIACNLPVILSDIPQHKEIMDALPNCGFNFTLGDLDALMFLIKKIIENYQEYKNAWNLAHRSSLTMEKMGLMYKNYYRSAR